MVDERLLSHPDAKKALDDLHDKGLNFDLSRRDQFTPENGWYIDDFRQPLPPEPPGATLPDGSWEVARQLIRDYEFADPNIIRAVYYPDAPLEKRDMLLEAKFYGLRFYLGVRIGGVNDETRRVRGRDVRVWGWNYRTLQGHLEMGQMDYEVWKWQDTGEVEFRIDAFSRPANIHNPIIKLGFRMFGRRMQLKFARRACQRMQRLTRAGLARQARHEGVRRTSGNLAVAPASADRPLHNRLERHRHRDPG